MKEGLDEGVGEMKSPPLSTSNVKELILYW